MTEKLVAKKIVEEKVLVDIQDVLELPEGATIITVNKDLYHYLPFEVVVSVLVSEDQEGKGPFVKVNKTAAGKKREEEAKKEADAKYEAAKKEAEADAKARKPAEPKAESANPTVAKK